MTNDLEHLYSEAFALYHAGYLSEAEEKYQQILKQNNTQIDAWRELGRVYLFQERYDEALDAFYYILELDSSQAIHYYYCGLALEKIGDLTSAIQAYHEAIALDPNLTEIYLKLGDILLELAEFEQAEANYRQAIRLNPESAFIYFKLGNLLVVQQQLEAAISTYQTALKFDPANRDILYQLGVAYAAHQKPVQASFYLGCAAQQQEEYELAICYYQDCLKNQTQPLETYLKLADCYQQIEYYDKAIEIYQSALQNYPDFYEIYLDWIQLLQNIGETEKAIKLAEKALQKFPENISLKLADQRLLPILYQTPEEIQNYRQRFTQKLIELSNKTQINTPEAREIAFKSIGEGTFFYLQYQGLNDLEIQKQYGNFVHRVIAEKFPNSVSKISQLPLKKTEKIRIGYVSRFFHWHTVGTIFLGWLRHRNYQQFEVYCYYIGTEEDEVTELFRWYSDRFNKIYHDVEKISQKIREDQLHILVFLDVGMCSVMTQLAGMRLTPIQCATWGHPVTTGLPNIDYFISAECLEPNTAASHYSEEIILLPHLGINYPKPAIPLLEKTRLEWGIRQDAVLYLSSQSLFKYLPQYDQIFVEISQQVPQAKIVFFSHWNTPIAEKFRQRLQRKFAKVGLKSEDYCMILPRMNKCDYLQLHLMADIALDTIKFTGFMTTLDSLACNLPVVTMEGELMRSRQSAGILKRIGVTETIAQNEVEYLKIAVKLGLDPDWRFKISQKIKQNQSILYDDLTCVQALEEFYQRVVKSEPHIVKV